MTGSMDLKKPIAQSDILSDATPFAGANVDAAISSRATPAQVLTQVQTEVGAFSGQTNLKTLLAALGIPDVAGNTLHKLLITDRLDHATYGLSALQALLAKFWVVKAPVQLDQAAPVQNTWYTVADLTNGKYRLIGIAAQIDTTNETLGARLTVDGNAINGSLAATAGSYYNLEITHYSYATPLNLAFKTGAEEEKRRHAQIEGKNIKFELRKTTAAGTGNLKGTLIYASWE